MNKVLRQVTDFRVITLAVASALAVAATNGDARAGEQRSAQSAKHSGTTSVQRSRGADGAVDATRTNRKGGVTSVDRFKDGTGTTDATITGPRGGVSNVVKRAGPSFGQPTPGTNFPAIMEPRIYEFSIAYVF